MKHFFLLSLLTVSAWGRDTYVRPLELSISGTGTIGFDRKFESLGRSMVLDADSLLKPWGGYNKLYAEYLESHSPSPTLWQNVLRFQNFLDQNYGAVAPAEILGMRMGLEGILNSHSDAEIPPLMSELGRNLSFEQKIAFGSQLGGVLLEGYDHGRETNDRQGVITLRDMLSARQSGGKAGVCRDISVAVAKSLSDLGIKQTFIVTYLASTSGHAVVLAQDPNNAAKTYSLNYNFVTSNESASSATHLTQDSGVPDTGIQYDIYDVNGKILSTLPSNLGLMLKEMAGGNVADLDPMARSENSVLSAVIGKYHGLDASVGVGSSPSGDQVVALTAGYTLESERVPGRYAVQFYSNTRPSGIGQLQQKGLYLTGNQKIRSKPWVIDTGHGVITSRILGQIDLNMQIMSYYVPGQDSSHNYVLARGNGTASASVETNYEHNGTSVNASISVNGSAGKTDVRDEQNFNTLPYMKDVTVNVIGAQELASGLDGFIKATLTVRQPELGSQMRTEAGARYRWNNNEVSLVAGREGSVSGPPLAFVPGSLEKYYAELTATFQKRFRASAGVYCSTTTRNCAIRGGGSFILPL